MKVIKNKKLSDSMKRAYQEGRRSKLIPWNKGISLSVEHKEKLSLIMKGKPGPNKGRKFSEETKQKMREAKLKNPTNYWLGKPRTEIDKKNISESLKGRYCGENHRFYGKHHTEETKEKLRMYTGDKASNWQGGKSFEPYTEEFNMELKQRIKDRDGNTCQICFKDVKGRYKSAVHHIDYDKNNSSEENLITLCKECHSKTNYDRDFWYKQFTLNPILRESHNIGNVIWF
jgi:hypothetical protein